MNGYFTEEQFDEKNIVRVDDDRTKKGLKKDKRVLHQQRFRLLNDKKTIDFFNANVQRKEFAAVPRTELAKLILKQKDDAKNAEKARKAQDAIDRADLRDAQKAQAMRDKEQKKLKKKAPVKATKAPVKVSAKAISAAKTPAKVSAKTPKLASVIPTKPVLTKTSSKGRQITIKQK
jgi:dsDNA-specific endonuclease/ATPase MutS2